MAQPNLPEDIADYINSLERRIRALETAPRATNTSIKDGAFTVLDAAGTPRARLGLLSDGVSYGIEVDDAAGTPISVNSTLFGIVAGVQTSVNVHPSNVGLGTALTSAEVDVVAGQTGKVFVMIGAQFVLDEDSTNAGISLALEEDGGGTNVFTYGFGTPAVKADFSNISDVNFTETVTPAGARLLAMTPGAHNLKLYARRQYSDTNSIVNAGFVIAIPL